MKVLISEDDGVARLVIEQILSKCGHEVVATTNGKDARDRFDEEHFHVVISDVWMPSLSGFDLCRHIRAQDRDAYTYIILVTSFEGERHYLEGIEAGADDFLMKPFSALHIRARLHVADRIVGLQRRLGQLESMLSVCAWCKRIRDDDAWVTLESYLSRHRQTSISHGMCSACFERVTNRPAR